MGLFFLRKEWEGKEGQGRRASAVAAVVEVVGGAGSMCVG